MFPEDYLTDYYSEGYASAERDHEDGADPAAMLLLADALQEVRADDPDREAYYRGRVDYLRGALRAG
jgi:hypothetical protein